VSVCETEDGTTDDQVVMFKSFKRRQSCDNIIIIITNAYT